jgi:hypothetical protein
MRVLLLSRYCRLGASSRMRCLQYLPLLAKWGIDVDTKESEPIKFSHFLQLEETN